MSYDLSFSESFFTPEEDIYSVKASDKPTTLYQAIITLQERCTEAFTEACVLAGLLGKDHSLSVEHIRRLESLPFDLMIYAKEEVNTCSNITSPVKVWLDKEGYYTVYVYDTQEEE